jgi:GTP 3',8-cyclase
MYDRYNRDLTYLRVSITDRCNLRCAYCMPEEGVEQMHHEELLSYEELYTVIKTFVGLGVKKLRITGGEPLVRKDVVSFVGKVAQLKELEDIAMTTNAVLLKEFAKPLKEAGLHRVNISLDTLKDDRYRLLSRGGQLKNVLEGINAAQVAGLKIKINCVVNKGINEDEISDFIQLTKTWGVDVRFIELMPISKNISYAQEHFYSNELILANHPELMPVEADDPSSPARYFKLENAKGKVGLISPLSCNFCAFCNRLRLTPDGKLKPCLHSDIEIDLKSALRSNSDILPLILESYKVKPEKHLLDEHQMIVRQMSQIGG